MRLMVVHPGADVAISDVHDGLVAALRRQGHLVSTYALNVRMTMAGRYLHWLWKQQRKHQPDLVKPTSVDVLEKASEDIVPRALTLNVDAVLIVSAMYLHPDALVLLRRARIPTGLIFTESPYDDERQARLAPLADVCWTQERTSVAPLRRANKRTHYLPAAYDAHRHTPEPQPGDEDVPAHDVVFVGTLFKERIKLLSSVDWTGIDLGLYGNMELLGSRSTLRQYVRGEDTDNATAAALYRRAKIGLNLFRSTAEWTKGTHVTTGESMNPRNYELAACGCCQVTSWRPEVGDVFGANVACFASPRELRSVVTAALQDDVWRDQSAFFAARNVQGHTFDHRARQLMDQFGAAMMGQPLAMAAD